METNKSNALSVFIKFFVLLHLQAFVHWIVLIFARVELVENTIFVCDNALQTPVHVYDHREANEEEDSFKGYQQN